MEAGPLLENLVYKFYRPNKKRMQAAIVTSAWDRRPPTFTRAEKSLQPTEKARFGLGSEPAPAGGGGQAKNWFFGRGRLRLSRSVRPSYSVLNRRAAAVPGLPGRRSRRGPPAGTGT